MTKRKNKVRRQKEVMGFPMNTETNKKKKERINKVQNFNSIVETQVRK